MWSGNFKTAVSSLRQRRWRTIFTMLGIIIGIASVVTVVSLGDGLKSQVTGQSGRLNSDVITIRPGKLMNNKGGLSGLNLYAFLAPSTLTARDADTVSNLGSIKTAVPLEFVTNVARGDNGELDNVFVAGTDSQLFGLLHLDIAYGAPFIDNDVDQNFAVIGSDMALKLFGELNPVGSTVHINGQDFIIHGVLSPAPGGLLSVAQADFNSSIFIPTSAADTLTGGHTNVLQILARAKDPKNVDKTVSDVRGALARNHGGTVDFTVLKQKDLAGVSDEVIGRITRYVSTIASISLLVGGIGIMNIMLVSVSERTREIGIRKAIGATNRQILNQFLVEGLVLSIGGGIIGVIVSLLINLLLRLYTSWHPVISVPTMILAVGVSVGAGIIFSLAPALQAASKNPIEALRGS